MDREWVGLLSKRVAYKMAIPKEKLENAIDWFVEEIEFYSIMIHDDEELMEIERVLLRMFASKLYED